ncbi:MAG: TonB-dependent receptor plug domain-containing protein [Bacteroidota bacterium]|nr:TonB-dependent receptor plug domain-containing protein [Bacteroidota bacterium]
MNPLFVYLLKASVTVFILWAFYSLCLRRMTFHRLNRYFFLAGILVSLIWPALPLTEWFSKAPSVNQVVVYIPVSALMLQLKPATPTFGIETAIRIIYFAGVLYMLTRLTIQIISLRVIFKQSEIRVINGVKVRVVSEKVNPFSFFGYIFLNPANHTPVELTAIILHEKIHETKFHSIDILLSELFRILLWFNPFTWLFCRGVKENIEFEVDRILLYQGIDCKEYQYNLLKLSSCKNQIVITNHFNLSNLKTRIIMMNKNQSSKYGIAAYVLVIPLILLCMVFSYAFAQNKPIADTLKTFTLVQQKPEKELDKSLEKALILLDGKVVKYEDVKAENIYSMSILKGKEATAIYGKRGKNGVVLITSKQNEPEKKTVITYRITDSTGNKNAKPVIIIDGKEVSEKELKDLSPDAIENIEVYKDGMSTAGYGDKGKNGVVKITVKKNISTGHGEGSNFSYSTSSSSTGNGKTFTVVADQNGKNKGEGSSTVTLSANGDKTVTEKTYVITDDSGEGHEKQYVIRSTHGANGEKGTVNSSESTFKFPEGTLMIVDGKEVSQEGIAKINPQDISTVSVLKGKMATEQYGEKGAKGVIVITTKKK